MTRFLTAAVLLIFASCSTPRVAKRPVPAKEVLPSASTIYASPDGSIYATLRTGTEPFSIAIIERETGRLLGVAASSANLTPDRHQMYGQIRVTFSNDLSAIVVHEDFSDASPNPRYILFERRPGGKGYKASYFAPPTVHIDTPGEFDFMYPRIQSVTNEVIAFVYGDPDRTRIVRIDNLLRASSPRSAEMWPSEAYGRYDTSAQPSQDCR